MSASPPGASPAFGGTMVAVFSFVGLGAALRFDDAVAGNTPARTYSWRAARKQGADRYLTGRSPRT